MPFELGASGAVTGVEGPLVFLKRVVEVGLGEAVEVEGADGRVRLGRIVSLDEDSVVVELVESTAGLGVEDVTVRFRGEPMQMALGAVLVNTLHALFEHAEVTFDVVGVDKAANIFASGMFDRFMLGVLFTCLGIEAGFVGIQFRVTGDVADQNIAH